MILTLIASRREGVGWWGGGGEEKTEKSTPISGGGCSRQAQSPPADLPNDMDSPRAPEVAQRSASGAKCCFRDVLEPWAGLDGFRVQGLGGLGGLGFRDWRFGFRA